MDVRFDNENLKEARRYADRAVEEFNNIHLGPLDHNVTRCADYLRTAANLIEQFQKDDYLRTAANLIEQFQKDINR